MHAADDADAVEAAAVAASKCECAVLLVGLPPTFESEGLDREHIDLPPQMDALVSAVCSAQPRTVVVLANGAPVAMPWAAQPGAILEMYLSGQASGSACADLLFGEAVPSGKLAESFPASLGRVPSSPFFADHAQLVVYREGLNVGYRHYCGRDGADEAVLFPFGHGLSYTTFGYAKLELCTPNAARMHGTAAGMQRMLPSESLDISFELSNSGDIAGAEIAQCYVRALASTVPRPDRELREFAKVHLQRGEAETVRFTLPPRAFAYYDLETRAWRVEPGEYEVLIGSSALDIRLSHRLLIAQPAGSEPEGAREGGGPSLPQAHPMSDSQLLKLGCAVPSPPPLYPFHRETLVSTLETHGGVAAKVFYHILMRAAGSVEDIVEQKARTEILRQLPLQQLMLFAHGSSRSARFFFSNAVLRGLITLLNIKCSPENAD